MLEDRQGQRLLIAAHQHQGDFARAQQSHQDLLGKLRMLAQREAILTLGNQDHLAHLDRRGTVADKEGGWELREHTLARGVKLSVTIKRGGVSEGRGYLVFFSPNLLTVPRFGSGPPHQLQPNYEYRVGIESLAGLTVQEPQALVIPLPSEYDPS